MCGQADRYMVQLKFYIVARKLHIALYIHKHRLKTIEALYKFHTLVHAQDKAGGAETVAVGGVPSV